MTLKTPYTKSNLETHRELAHVSEIEAESESLALPSRPRETDKRRRFYFYFKFFLCSSLIDPWSLFDLMSQFFSFFF